MKLIKVEAYGFKSFADRVTLNFDGGIVGIVGPNGSGKSNINDAIKWVLGEQSSKALRGDKMEDVIFAGSKTVKALDRAEVILTFDNKNKTIKNQEEIITITRIMERRKGSNLYLVNGEPARQKDIKEIAMESGMSKSSLAIISQGTISEIAQATPEQRRKVFEEAAGTSMYKSRKIETQRKLERTNEALEKVQTIIRELNRQLAPLEKQAKNASVYLEKSKNLKSVEVSLISEELTFFKEQVAELRITLDDVEESKYLLTEKIVEEEKNITTKSEDLIELEKSINELETKLSESKDVMLDLEKRESEIRAQRKLILNGTIQATDKDKIEALKGKLKSLNEAIIHYEAWRTKIQENIRLKIIQNDEQQKLRIENNKELLLLTTKHSRTSATLTILNETLRNKAYLFQGTRTIVDNSSLFKGYVGLISDLIKVDGYYQPAIESVLKAALQHVVVETSSDAVTAINFLKKNKGGKATFIPLEKINEKYIREEHKLVLEVQKGYLGIGSNLIKIDERYKKLAKFLLGNIVVVDDIKNANRISNLMKNRYLIVTLDGDIIRQGGIITGGHRSAVDNTLGLKEKIKKLEELMPSQRMLISHARTLDINYTSLIETQKSEISTFSQDVERANTSLRANKSEFDSTKIRFETLSSEIIELDSNINFENEIRKREIEATEMKNLLDAKKQARTIIIEKLSESQIQKTKNEKALRLLLQEFNDKLNQKERAKLYIAQATKRLSEHYELTLEFAVENYPLTMDKEEARKIVTDLTKEIKALGHINLDAIKSYEEVGERHRELSESLEELQNAHNVIINAIEELDKIIIIRMRDTIETVNKEFNNVFRAMFGGGTAEIKFVDPGDLLESGIDIIAQPPGKAVKNLKLFSGGEKSLIAISLLFAILKAKPLPLCILDEVEAALDEANVIRFAEFLQKLKSKTQFLVITHRQGTMARVDHLFGATMQKRGVTTFFSVDINVAKTLVDKASTKIKEDNKLKDETDNKTIN